MLDKDDINYLNKYGIEQKTLQEQIGLLHKNDSFIELLAPAILDKGIRKIENKEYYINLFEQQVSKHKLCKFVPASGAATRMFKRLISYQQKPTDANYSDGDSFSVKYGFENIKKFAFYDKLISCKNNISTHGELAEMILFSCLGYAGIPKGLVEFHSYPDGPRTAFEEHLHEAVEIDKTGNINIHLTVSPEFIVGFKEKLKQIQSKTGINLQVDFSVQERSTDTVAIYNDGNIVRDKDGNILLRPGGHGALLQNLNKIDADIVFIKNIDNLTHGDYLNKTLAYKKLLGGVLIESVQEFREINAKLKSSPNESNIKSAIEYIKKEFNADLTYSKDKVKDILAFINRPIRVCGMVQNTGEPGGGPFWVKGSDGTSSLQIVEKAQINLDLKEQQKHFMAATHFNPVDLVCYIKNLDGERINLNNYVDKNACFVSEKTYQGKKIRVLEHPGLWNGAMANWLTIFVEVPLNTFNPVKELNDLLRPMHQPKK
ncbi:MAG: DUF4301 family protein [Bacteroidales bacterium]|nr:DUF4301 family protein [Bacteroidales bacterium]